MYEQRVYHAIQNTNNKDLSTRYRTYNTEEERDLVFNSIKGELSGREKVTLIVTAVTVPEQLSLEI